MTPGTSVALRAVAKDQNGQTMGELGPAEFSSEHDALATVGEDGTVTAAGPGTALITASVTAGEITRSGTATVTVKVPPPAAVQAPGLEKNVLMKPGGKWRIVQHQQTLVAPGS